MLSIAVRNLVQVNDEVNLQQEATSKMLSEHKQQNNGIDLFFPKGGTYSCNADDTLSVFSSSSSSSCIQCHQSHQPSKAENITTLVRMEDYKSLNNKNTSLPAVHNYIFRKISDRSDDDNVQNKRRGNVD